MTQRTFIDKNGNSWEWEETPEVVAALAKLQESSKETQHKLANLKLKRPHERQNNNG